MTGARIPGELLKSARAAAGLSQRELARKARTAQSVVARIELGETSPTWATLTRLLRAAGFRPLAELEQIPKLDRQRKNGALDRALAYGVDVSLLRDGLATSVSDRLALLDENAAFIRELRRSAGADQSQRRPLSKPASRK